MAFKKSKMKWRNKMSGEEGFVQTVSKKNGYFISTFEDNDAKNYTNQKSVDTDLEFLASIGETERNEFFLVQA